MHENNSTAPGNLSKDSEGFGKVPHDAESFRTVPNDSANFGNIPNSAERKENHTLTVREVARMFEVAGVARTERSITNWCQPNKSGIARLDAYFDPNERRYFITAQSVELAIQEEKARSTKEGLPSEPSESIPKPSEAPPKRNTQNGEYDTGRIKELELEILDLRINNRGKDFFIAELRNERKSFELERQEYVEKLMTFNRKMGELETKLLQLEAPSEEETQA